jgi:hypothetical protein
LTRQSIVSAFELAFLYRWAYISASFRTLFRWERNEQPGGRVGWPFLP